MAVEISLLMDPPDYAGGRPLLAWTLSRDAPLCRATGWPADAAVRELREDASGVNR